MLPTADVTICIPTIPVRRATLCRAVTSVIEQTVNRVLIAAQDDTDPRQGAWATRNAAAAKASTTWIGFLDDDDELLPHHVEFLLELAGDSYDMVWGWFEVHGGTDPFPMHRGRQFDPLTPHIVPITYLIRRELFMDTRGFLEDETRWGSWETQDMTVVLDAYEKSGGRLHASPEVTWRWYHHGWNTSGLPERPAGPC
jgi:glycosyltransferase involved in cell wall biosynthesis